MANEALETADAVMQAKENGDLDGFDPIVELTPQENGVLLTITDVEGPKEELIPKGDKGDAGTIEIGTVTTGTAGSQASVVNVGTADTAILNITIPRGDQGMGLTIKGNYESYEAFIEEHPTGVEGENWQVTTGRLRPKTEMSSTLGTRQRENGRVSDSSEASRGPISPPQL